MNVIFNIILILFILIGVSFFTLFEQKGLSYLQIRKGPNKVSMIGLLQPFSDAIKLFSKECTLLNASNYLIYYICPIMSLLVSLSVWYSLPFIFNVTAFNMSFLFFLSCLSMGVYSIMLAGWSSNSSYSLLGGMRAIAQTISYEVCLVLIFLSYLVLMNSMQLSTFTTFQGCNLFFFLNIPVSFVIFIIFLAETNRSPFDFAEGESELVSGFNVEYSSGNFAILFLAEYSSILFMSMFFVLSLLGGSMLSWTFFLSTLLISWSFIWVRASFPRYRYDLLMFLTWKKYLPISLNFVLIFLSYLALMNSM